MKKKLFYFFLILSAISLVDKITGVLFYNRGFGVVNHLAILLFGVENSLFIIIMIISDFALLWLLLAFLLRPKKKEGIKDKVINLD